MTLAISTQTLRARRRLVSLLLVASLVLAANPATATAADPPQTPALDSLEPASPTSLRITWTLGDDFREIDGVVTGRGFGHVHVSVNVTRGRGDADPGDNNLTLNVQVN